MPLWSDPSIHHSRLIKKMLRTKTYLKTYLECSQEINPVNLASLTVVTLKLNCIFFADFDAEVKETPPEIININQVILAAINSYVNCVECINGKSTSSIHSLSKVLSEFFYVELRQLLNGTSVWSIWSSEKVEDVLCLLRLSGNIGGQTTILLQCQVLTLVVAPVVEAVNLVFWSEIILYFVLWVWTEVDTGGNVLN